MRPSILTALLVLVSCKTPRGGQELKSTPAPPPSSVVEALGMRGMCLGDREPFPASGRLDPKLHLDTSANGLTLGNAYWLGVLSSLGYTDGSVWTNIVKEKLNHSVRSGLIERFTFVDIGSLDEDDIDADTKRWFDFFYKGTEFLFLKSKDAAIFSFRGTESIRDLITDADLMRTDAGTFSYRMNSIPRKAWERSVVDEDKMEVKIHNGFYHSARIATKIVLKMFGSTYWDYLTPAGVLDNLLKVRNQERRKKLTNKFFADTLPMPVRMKYLSNWQKVRKKERAKGRWHLDQIERDSVLKLIKPHWTHKPKNVWFSGHSLGGAIAMTFAHKFMRLGFNVQGMYTYGQPRVGNKGFVREFNLRINMAGKKGNFFRFINQNDVVARVPPVLGIVDRARFKHDRRGKYFRQDDDTGFGVRLYVENDDLDTLIPGLPKYVKGRGTPLEERKRFFRIKEGRVKIADLQKIGVRDNYDGTDWETYFPKFVKDLDKREILKWIKHHSMVEYVNNIGYYIFDGESSLCRDVSGS